MEKARRPAADVAIVGGGILGHVLATALSRVAGPGLSVLLIAPAAQPRQGASRAIALTSGAVAMLEAIGIWPAIAGQAQPMERIIVTDGRPGGSQLSLLEFADDRGAGPSAHVVDEALLAQACAAAARDCPGVQFIDDRVTGFDGGQASAVLTLASGDEIKASLVAAADGASSTLRNLAGIKTVGWSYGQSALVATVTHIDDHRGVAVERFLPAGPFAILPLPERSSSLVWTESAARAQTLAADADELMVELAERWDTERGAIENVGPVAAFPLSFHIARRFVAPRLALLGDAAHQVHPLAGQGLNLGLRDAAALTEIVIGSRRLGLDAGDAASLERYERWRRFDTISSALAYDGLNRLFSNDRDALRVARDLGLGLVDRLPGLKRVFMREAAGVTGVVPKLMAGETV